MTAPETKSPFVAIACGGTGGHLFPGIAVAEELKKRGCKIALLISPKDIDQQSVKSAIDMEVFTLPAVGLQNRNYFSFGLNFWKSFCASRKIFKTQTPDAVLAMGGFTSAPPILAARKFGAKTFLHESNTIPGRANRFLARFVDEAFVGFPETESRLRAKKVSITGTPVRPQFCSSERESAHSENQSRLTSAATIKNCRAALGLDPNLPTILVVGGSQGASGLNEMILSALPLFQERGRPARESAMRDEHAGGPPALQWLHLTGANDFEKVKQAYIARGIKAVVKPFLAEMDLALSAATVAVSRAGASSLAEIAAMRLPSLLIPFPAAADNHQFINALAFEKTGAAKLLEQKNSTPEKVAAILTELVENDLARSEIQNALAQWHAPRAAELIAEKILTAIFRSADSLSARLSPNLDSRTSRPRSDAMERQNFSAA